MVAVEGRMDLDTILVREIGQLGWFQRRSLVLASVIVVFSAYCSEYVFTTARINTRCLIPECENVSEAVFTPSWLTHAVPSSAGAFDRCQRFTNASVAVANGTCPAEMFNSSEVLPCEQYVYENTDTVVYDFDLGCNEWGRSLLGFVRGFGMVVALPLTGYVSDRWGRRTALLISIFNTAWVGVARYWATSYALFMASQFVESMLGNGVYSCSFVLVLELVGPKYRVVAGALMQSSFSIGQVIMGLIAWAVPNWRTFTLALYIPMLLSMSYFWLIPESVRWYMSKSRHAEAEALLKEVARVNKKPLSEKSLNMLKETAREEKKNALDESNEPWLIVIVFRHKQVLLRCVIIPIWWVTMTLVYYGLGINAVNISGSSYVNYVAVSAAELPGTWLSVLLLDRLGRRPVLMAAFWICAASQIGYIFMPDGAYGISLSLYLVGKCSITVVATAIYVYTAELFPTRHRHGLLAFCSCVGRAGNIAAPLTPAMGAATFEELPFVLFGGFALVSGLTLSLTPETLGARLPDTMDQAENIYVPKEL